MPVSWRLLESVILLETDDPATFAEWSAAIDAALEHPGVKRGVSVVHDARRLTRVISEGEAKLRVAFLSDRHQKYVIRRWALVVPAQAPYAMREMLQALSDSAVFPCRVLTDLAEALEWAREGGDGNPPPTPV